MSWFTRMFKGEGDDVSVPPQVQDKNQSHSDQGAKNTDPMAQETDSAVALADDQNDVEQSDTNQ